jgi:hypothetical protein
LGWSIVSVDSAPAGVTATSATQIQGRSLSIGASSPLTVAFTARAPCGTTNPAWGLVARSGGNFSGNTFTTNVLSTPLSGSCAAAFAAGRGPANAAFNGNPRSENITSAAYTPAGAAMQVLVTDAEGAARAGVSITLALRCTAPVVCAPPASGADLTGPVTATSDGAGLATFTGSSSNAIAIDTIGLRYRLEPTGSGVVGTLSAEFGIYEEGEQCPGASCEVHGSDNHGIDASVSADTPSGSLAVLVSNLLDLDCGPTIPSGYDYRSLSSSVIAWLYTGTGSQTITVLVDKTLLQTDAGASHLDFCYLVEGIDPLTGLPKTFTDKFGNVTSGPALLPDCNSTIVRNCILSETAAQGGDRLVTVTVEDGRAKP